MNPADTPILPPLTARALPSESSAIPAVFTDEDLDVLQSAIPERAKALRPDTLAFWRELPGLLANGQEGRCALVHDRQIVSLWDSVSDAAQAGYDQFGPDAVFLTPLIKRLELQRIGQFLAQERAKQCHS